MTIETRLKTDFTRDYPLAVVRLVDENPDMIDEVSDTELPALVEFVERATPEMAQALFARLDSERQLALLQEVSIRTSLMILHGLGETNRAALLEGLPSGTRKQLEEILIFPEDSAGNYMEVVSGHHTPDNSIEEVLVNLKASGVTGIRSIYLVNENNILAGRADMQSIALAEPGTRLRELMHPVEGVAELTAPRDQLVEIFNQYRVDSIPIVDQDMRLIGVVRYPSLFHAAEESLTSDMQKMVGASPDERALSPALFAVKKRLPWLHINLLTAFLAASVVGVFEETIAQFTALAILLPVVAGQSGNAGSQALAVTMRGLALREINLMKWRPVLIKELWVGVIDGVALAFTCGLGVFVWSSSIGLAIVIGIAMIVSMIAAGISGALVPMALIRFGQDPATASSIILTTVTDIAGFISFLGTATLLAFML